MPKRPAARPSRRTASRARRAAANRHQPAAETPRGRLKSLRVSDSFRDFALDQLADVAHLRPRAMFGGIGLYAGDIFFGILAADTLYLKVGDENRESYEVAGSHPFAPYADRPMTMPYWNVPATVLEDADMLVMWARQAIVVAQGSGDRKRRRRRAR